MTGQTALLLQDGQLRTHSIICSKCKRFTSLNHPHYLCGPTILIFSGYQWLFP